MHSHPSTNAASIPHAQNSLTPALRDSTLQIPTPQRLANRTHPTRHPAMLHISRQRLFQRTLRHARVIQITEATAHTRRAVTTLARRPIVPSRAFMLTRRKSQFSRPSRRKRTVRWAGLVRCRRTGKSGGVGAAGGGVEGCGFHGYSGCGGGEARLLGEA